MGQKVNQTIFRASLKDFEYNQKYLEKNTEESTLLLYTNSEITEYINTVFNLYDVLVHTCKLEYNQDSVNVIIYFFDLNFKTNKILAKNTKKKLISAIITNLLPLSLNLYLQTKKINITTKNLNKIFENTNSKQILQQNLKHFKKILKIKGYKDLIKAMFIAVCEKNSSKMLAEIIAIYISKHKKKHYYLFSVLKRYFNILIGSKNSKIKGLKIAVSGRINGAPRAKTLKIQIGSISLPSFNSLISYGTATAYTANGSFGVKVWICEK